MNSWWLMVNTIKHFMPIAKWMGCSFCLVWMFLNLTFHWKPILCWKFYFLTSIGKMNPKSKNFFLKEFLCSSSQNHVYHIFCICSRVLYCITSKWKGCSLIFHLFRKKSSEILLYVKRIYKVLDAMQKKNEDEFKARKYKWLKQW